MYVLYYYHHMLMFVHYPQQIPDPLTRLKKEHGFVRDFYKKKTVF